MKKDKKKTFYEVELDVPEEVYDAVIDFAFEHIPPEELDYLFFNWGVQYILKEKLKESESDETED